MNKSLRAWLLALSLLLACAAPARAVESAGSGADAERAVSGESAGSGADAERAVSGETGARKEDAVLSPVQTAAPGWLVPRAKVYDGRFSDAPGAWCEGYITTVYEAALMEGRAADRFDAAAPLTNAQITVVTARLHSLLNGADGSLPAAAAGEAWYGPAVTYLNAHSDDETLLYLLNQLSSQPDTRPNAPCLRRDFVWMLAGVLPEGALPELNAVSALPDSLDAHVPEFYRAGILNGLDEYGSFRGENPLTRGAAAAMLSRIADPAQRLRFTLKPYDLSRDVLGMEPETVLLIVDGENVTADVFGETLIAVLSKWGRNGGQAAVADAVANYRTYRAAHWALARQLGIALSAAEKASLETQAKAKDGALGHGAAYWAEQYETILLQSKTKDDYARRYEDKVSEAAYHTDLEKAGEAVVIEEDPVLKTLDLTAVYDRYAALPFTP